MPHPVVGIGVAIGLCLLPPLSVVAGSLQVGPTRVALADSASVESITVRNAGDAPMIVELEKYAWRQRRGVDEYEPTDELIATPPVFRVAAGDMQVVRIGVRRPAEPGSQRAYRVYVREVPSDLRDAKGGLRVALRIGVPVFQGASQAPANLLTWQAIRTDDGQVAITADNATDAFVHVTEVQLCPDSGADCVWRSVEGAYVLAHGSHAWRAPLLPAAVDSRMRLLVKTDHQSLHSEVLIQR